MLRGCEAIREAINLVLRVRDDANEVLARSKDPVRRKAEEAAKAAAELTASRLSGFLVLIEMGMATEGDFDVETPSIPLTPSRN